MNGSPETMPSPQDLLFCFLDATRPCDPSCTAFSLPTAGCVFVKAVDALVSLKNEVKRHNDELSKKQAMEVPPWPAR